MGYSFTSPYSQKFALPYFMIPYMPKACSAKVYKKLTLTCKYFFASTKLIIPEDPSLGFDTVNRNGDADWTLNPIKKQLKRWDKVTIDLTQVKLWLEESVHARTQDRRAFGLLFPFVGRFKNMILDIDNQDLFVHEFLMVAPFLKTLYIKGSNILDSEGRALKLGEILAMTPNLKLICIIFSDADSVVNFGITVDTPVSNLRRIRCSGITTELNGSELFELMMKLPQCVLDITFKDFNDAFYCHQAIMKAVSYHTFNADNKIKINRSPIVLGRKIIIDRSH